MSGNLYDGDQPTVRSVVVGETDDEQTVASIKTLATDLSQAPVYIFSVNYNFVWMGQAISYRYGIPYQLDPALLAALTAAGAPMVAA